MRVRLQVPVIDAAILRGLAAILRDDSAAHAVRDKLRVAVGRPSVDKIFDLFGCELPDAYFDGVFERSRAKVRHRS